MVSAEKELQKQGDKGEKQAVGIQERLCLGVWCRWALGQRRKWFVQMSEPEDLFAWSWAGAGRDRVGSAFCLCANAKKQRAFDSREKRHWLKQRHFSAID